MAGLSAALEHALARAGLRGFVLDTFAPLTGAIRELWAGGQRAQVVETQCSPPQALCGQFQAAPPSPTEPMFQIHQVSAIADQEFSRGRRPQARNNGSGPQTCVLQSGTDCSLKATRAWLVLNWESDGETKRSM